MTLRTIAALLVVALLERRAGRGYDLGNRAPEKPASHHSAPPPDQDVIRQGGDTIADAVPITVPTIDLAGTTVGYNDDYDEVCPYTQSTSPDVVYKFAPDRDVVVDIDMFGSTYDTKIYVYCANLDLVACNDDFYSGLRVQAGERGPVPEACTYYLVDRRLRRRLRRLPAGRGRGCPLRGGMPRGRRTRGRAAPGRRLRRRCSTAAATAPKCGYPVRQLHGERALLSA